MQDKNYQYFLENMESLYKQYGHKFLAIKNQSVIGVYDSFNDALESTLKTEALGTFLVQECFENKDKSIHNFQGNVTVAPMRISL